MSLPLLPDISRLSERVIRVLGQNPGAFTLQGTNTYVVGTGASRILIDSGEGIAEYLPVLQKALADNKVEQITDILITHHHYDHVGGIEAVEQLFPSVIVRKMVFDEETTCCKQPNPIKPFKYELLSDGEVITTEGATLRVLHTPGHTPDHLMFFLEEVG